MKKKIIAGLAVLGLISTTQSTSAQFVDLATGKQVNLVKNQANGIMYNPESQRPIYIYTNVNTKDTLYGRTGAVINGHVLKQTNGTYVYAGDSAYIFSNGDYRLRKESDNYKRRFDSDGDVILTGENFKKKTEIDGDVKIKDGDSKVKIEGDGVLKVKDGNYKKKIDSEGNYLEKDSTLKFKAKTDGSVKLKDASEDYKGKVGEDGDMKVKKGEMKRKLKKDGKRKVKNGDQS